MSGSYVYPLIDPSMQNYESLLQKDIKNFDTISEKHQEQIRFLSTNSNSNCFASLSDDNTLAVWDFTTRSLVFSHKLLIRPTCMAISGKELFFGGSNGTINISTKSTLTNTVATLSYQITALALSPSSELIAASTDQNFIITLINRTNSLLTTLQGHQETIYQLSFTQNNKFLLSASSDTKIFKFDIQASSSPPEIITHDSPVLSISTDKFSSILLSYSEKHFIRIWDLNNFKLLQEHNPDTSENFKVTLSKSQTQVTLSPNGEFVIYTKRNLIFLLKIGSNEVVMNLYYTHKNSIQAIILDNTGDLLVLGFNTGTIEYVNVQERSEEKDFFFQFEVTSLAISDKQRYLAVGASSMNINSIFEVLIWDLEEEKEVFRIMEDKNVVYSVKFDESENYLISASGEGSMRVTKFREGLTKVFYKSLDNKPIRSIVLIPKTTQGISVSFDDQVVKWDYINEKAVTLYEHKGSLYSVFLSEDKKILLTGTKESIKIWDLPDNYQKAFIETKSCIYSILIDSKNTFIVAGTSDKTLLIYTFPSIQLKKTLSGHTDLVRSVLLSKNEKQIFSGSEDNTIKIWDSCKFTLIYSFNSHNSRVSSLILTLNGQYLFSGSADKTVKKWSVGKSIPSRELAVYSTYKDCIFYNEYSKTLIYRKYRNFVDGIKISNNELLSENIIKDVVVNSLTMSSDSKYILFDANCEVTLYNTETQERKQLFKVDRNRTYALFISNSFRFILAGSEDNKVRLIEDPETDPVSVVKLPLFHTNPITSVAISFNDKYMLSSSYDCTVAFWQTCNPEEYTKLSGHKENVISASFTPDEKKIVSLSRNSVFIWNIFDKKCLFYVSLNQLTCFCVEFSNMYVLVGTENGKIKVIDLEARRVVDTIKAFEDGKIMYLHLSENWEHLITANPSSIKIFNIFQLKSKAFEMLDKGINNLALQRVLKTQDNKFEITFQAENMKNLKKVDQVNSYEKPFSWSPNCFFDRFNMNPIKFVNTLNCIKSKDFSPYFHSKSNLKFGQFCYTLAHILCFLGMNKELSQLYNENFYLDSDSFGKSPLNYSILRDNQKCTDSLLSFLASASKYSKFFESLSAISDDFQLIIKNSSNKLHLLMKTLLIPTEDYRGVLNQKLPIFLVDPYKEPNFDEFVSKTIKNESVVCNYFIMTSAMQINYKIYSEENIEFLEAILECSNKMIFKTEIVQYIIDNNWKAVYFWIFGYCFILFLNVFLFILLLAFEMQAAGSLVPFLVLNFVLFVLLVFENKADFKLYVMDFANVADLIRSIFIFIWQLLIYHDKNHVSITWVVGILVLGRGISGFALLDGARYYVQLIYSALNDIKYFLLILSYSNLVFGVLFLISRKEPIRFNTLWSNPYGLYFGQELNTNTSSEYTLEYIVYLVCTVINVILLLNLLISILGNAFDNFQEEKDIINYKEMTKLCLKVQKTFNVAKRRSEKLYFHVVENILPSGQKDEIQIRIEEMEENVFKRIQGLEDSFKSRFDKLLELVEEKNKKLKE